MVVVNTVEEFAKKNENDLRSLMNYKTGIFDKNLVDEAIQEFYVKLIETRALESYDIKAGSFNNYITSLFFWTLPHTGKKNFRIKFDVVSSVTISNGNQTQKNVDVWDLVSGVSEYTVDFEPKKPASKKTIEDEISNDADRSASTSFRVDCRFKCSAFERAQEDNFYRELRDFKKHIKKTEPAFKAERMITYIEKKMEGCLGVDIAETLKLSSAMIRIIKNDTKEKYLVWRKQNE